MVLEDELRCDGYFGFGGGYLWGKKYGRSAPQGEDRDLYCSSLCTRGEPCWYRHRGRVMFLLPLLAATFLAHFYDADNPHLTLEEWKKKRRTPEETRAALEVWAAKSGGGDPFSAVMAGNLEDGLAVALGGHPKDRQNFTLAWPFPAVAERRL